MSPTSYFILKIQGMKTTFGKRTIEILRYFGSHKSNGFIQTFLILDTKQQQNISHEIMPSWQNWSFLCNATTYKMKCSYLPFHPFHLFLLCYQSVYFYSVEYHQFGKEKFGCSNHLALTSKKQKRSENNSIKSVVLVFAFRVGM